MESLPLKKKDQSNFVGGTHLALFRGSLLFGLGTRLAVLGVVY